MNEEDLELRVMLTVVGVQDILFDILGTQQKHNIQFSINDYILDSFCFMVVVVEFLLSNIRQSESNIKGRNKGIGERTTQTNTSQHAQHDPPQTSPSYNNYDHNPADT